MIRHGTMFPVERRSDPQHLTRTVAPLVTRFMLPNDSPSSLLLEDMEVSGSSRGERLFCVNRCRVPFQSSRVTYHP